MQRIYMDYSATSPADPRVVQAMAPYWSQKFGNPSSIHGYGQETLSAVETAREQVALLLGAGPDEIVFTSGGTESDNAALKGAALALKEKGSHIVATAIEHHAVLHTIEFLRSLGFEFSLVPVGGDGIVDPADMARAVRKKTVLVSVMHANNEIGSIQPMADIGRIARERGILFHTDAVQTVGHIPIDLDLWHVDLLSLSAHKFYGPKGVGALYIRRGTRFVPFMHGGAQEAGRRSSTHNVPGIVGLGKAAAIARSEMEEERERVLALRNRLKNSLLALDGTRLNGHPDNRLPNNINLSFDAVEGESLLLSLDIEGIAASSGSACSSGSDEPSHVLKAIGLTAEQARGSLRLSLGKYTTEQEIDAVAEILPRTVRRLRSLSAFDRSTS